jgi:transcriptional regulator
MFVPDHYREPDGSWTVDLVRRNPLALLASNGTTVDGPFATHVPIIPDPSMAGEWSVISPGDTLLGHMNRTNPHWTSLDTGDKVLVVFTGPHAYVTPTTYGVTPAAPTWNFTAVHVHGVVSKISSVDETLEVVRSTVRVFEREFGSDWDMSGSIDYFRRIVVGVGAFRIEVSAAESMFKLSQEQRPEIRELVRRSFDGTDSARHRETARMMAGLPNGDRA